MRTGIGSLGASGLLACLTACSSLELPTPPDLEAAELAYDTPTAELTSAVAEAVLSEHFRTVQELEEVGGFGDVVDGIVALDRELQVGEDDPNVIELRGAPIRADALIELRVDCPGFSGEGPISSAIELAMVVKNLELAPVVFGPIVGCKTEEVIEGRVIRGAFDGDLAAFVPTLLAPDDVPTRIYVVYTILALHLNGVEVADRRGDFRLVEQSLEVRIDIADVGGHVVVFAGPSETPFTGVRAKNGAWRCFPKERRCERVASSDSFGY